MQLLVGVGDWATMEVLLRYPGSQATMLELMSLDRELCLVYGGFLLIPPWVQTVVFPDENCHQVLDQRGAWTIHMTLRHF